MAVSRSGRGSDVLEVLERRGAAAYLGEPVTLLEHSLQCAELAAEAGEDPELVAACLLHDMGWLLRAPEGEARHAAEQSGHDHAARGASFLARWFPESVHEPVRLHIEAKRFLVAVEPGALERLSTESRRTLALQGGPLGPEEVASFEARPQSAAALHLRRHDDAAKEPDRRCPPLSAYAELLDRLAEPDGADSGLQETSTPVPTGWPER